MAKNIPAPFAVGDVVTTSYPDVARDAPRWKTRVLSVYLTRGTYWLVVGAASEPCEHCHVVAHPQTPELNSGWFEAVP